MPWCPNCKEEYVDGITVCADCGTELVESLPEAPEFKTFMETEKELFAKKFVEFLHYSDIKTASYEFDEEKQQWVVIIEEKLEKQVTKLYKAFYSVESEHALSSFQGKTSNKKDGETVESENDETEAEDYFDEEEAEEYFNDDSFGDEKEDASLSEKETIDSDRFDIDNSDMDSTDIDYKTMFSEEELQDIVKSKQPKPVIPTAYVKKEEQYKDLKSSASTFIMVSLLGLAIVVLNLVGIIHIFNGPMPYIVMTLLLLAFLYIGITSYTKSKKVQKEIEGENNVTETINNWLAQNVTAEQLDDLTDPNETAEIRFFHKLEKMKEMITEKFGELDDSYLDLLVEEYYNENFEK